MVHSGCCWYAQACQPVAGVQVLVGTPFGPPSSTTTQARTDAEGHYRIEGLEAGPALLMAGREGVALKERQAMILVTYRW